MLESALVKMNFIITVTSILYFSWHTQGYLLSRDLKTREIYKIICAQGDQYHADPYDCLYFIQCSNRIPYRQKCATPLFWNQKLLTCQWSGTHCSEQIWTTATAETAVTTASTLEAFTSASDETTLETFTSSQALSSKEMSTLTTSNEELPSEFSSIGESSIKATSLGEITDTSTLPATTTIICEDGSVQISENCKYYLQCINGQEVRVECPDGTFWNQQIVSCTIDNKHCNGNIPNATTESFFSKLTDMSTSDLITEGSSSPDTSTSSATETIFNGSTEKATNNILTENELPTKLTTSNDYAKITFGETTHIFASSIPGSHSFTDYTTSNSLSHFTDSTLLAEATITNGNTDMPTLTSSLSFETSSFEKSKSPNATKESSVFDGSDFTTESSITSGSAENVLNTTVFTESSEFQSTSNHLSESGSISEMSTITESKENTAIFRTNSTAETSSTTGITETDISASKTTEVSTNFVSGNDPRTTTFNAYTESEASTEGATTKDLVTETSTPKETIENTTSKSISDSVTSKSWWTEDKESTKDQTTLGQAYQTFSAEFNSDIILTTSKIYTKSEATFNEITESETTSFAVGTEATSAKLTSESGAISSQGSTTSESTTHSSSVEITIANGSTEIITTKATLESATTTELTFLESNSTGNTKTSMEVNELNTHFSKTTNSFSETVTTESVAGKSSPTSDTTSISNVSTNASFHAITKEAATEKSNVCLNNNNRYLAQPIACSKYIECVDGESYVLSCPELHYWNAQLESCVKGDCAQPTTFAA